MLSIPKEKIMEKIQYIDENGTVYPSHYILNECTFVGIDADGFEVYKRIKHGHQEEIRVTRRAVEIDESIPYGYQDIDSLANIEVPETKI